MLLTLTGICLKPWTKCRRSVSCQVGVSLFRLSLCLSAGEKEEESLAESLMVLEAVSISCRTIQNCRTLVVAGDAKGERRIGIAVATLSLVGLSPSMPMATLMEMVDWQRVMGQGEIFPTTAMIMETGRGRWGRWWQAGFPVGRRACVVVSGRWPCRALASYMARDEGARWAPNQGRWDVCGGGFGTTWRVAGERETLCDDKVQPTVIIVHEEGNGCGGVRMSTASVSTGHFVLFRWEMFLVLSTANCPFWCCPLFKLISRLLMGSSEMPVVVSVDDSTERRQGVPTNR